MRIELTTNKYNVGCGRGYGINIPNLTLKLNLIIDKDRSIWPDENKEVKEGDVFLLDGTIFAIDHDRLVQIVSETGIYAFKRVYEEIIKPELDFCYFEDDDNEYSWDELKELPEDIELQEYTPQFEWMKIWRENFVQDRNLRPDYTIKVEIKDLMIGMVREIYMKSSKVYYLEDQFSEEELKYYLHKVLCWFYSEVGRVKLEKK